MFIRSSSYVHGHCTAQGANNKQEVARARSELRRLRELIVHNRHNRSGLRTTSEHHQRTAKLLVTRMKPDERCEDSSASTARSQFAGIELLQYLGSTPSACLHENHVHSEGCRESSAICARRYLCSANYSSSNLSSIYSQDDSDEGEDPEYASAGRQQRNPIELAHTERLLAADLLRRVRAAQDNTPPLTAKEATTFPRWLSWGRGTSSPSHEVNFSWHLAPSSASGLATDQQHSSKTTPSYAAKLVRKMRKRFSGLSFSPPLSLCTGGHLIQSPLALAPCSKLFLSLSHAHSSH